VAQKLLPHVCTQNAVNINYKCSDHAHNNQNAHRPSTVGANNLVFSSVFPRFPFVLPCFSCSFFAFCSDGGQVQNFVSPKSVALFVSLRPAPLHGSCTFLCLFASAPTIHRSCSSRSHEYKPKPRTKTKTQPRRARSFPRRMKGARRRWQLCYLIKTTFWVSRSRRRRSPLYSNSDT